MKKIGLLGGLSWTSTLDYYQYLNEGINHVLGGVEAAECVLYSLNFADIQRVGWPNAAEMIGNACQVLTRSGVDAVAICCNTAHWFADDIQAAIHVPLLHIGTASAQAIQQRGLHNVGLLGTRFTMEMPFYKDRLAAYGITTLVPEQPDDITEIQRIIRDELGKGVVTQASREKFLNYTQQLINRGAQGVLLACTELSMLIKPQDFSVPILDTAKIHVDSIIDFMLVEH